MKDENVKIIKLLSCELTQDKFEKYVDKKFYIKLKDGLHIEHDQYDDILELRENLNIHQKSLERQDAKTKAKIEEQKRIKNLPLLEKIKFIFNL